MERRRNFVVWTVFGTVLSLVLPIAGTLIAAVCFPEFRWTHLPVHSLVEGAGGLIAMAVAAILMAEIGRRENTGHYRWMAIALSGMGGLDLFHAASSPGIHFVWLHSLATFVGGICFGLVWLPNFQLPKVLGDRFVFAVVGFCLVVGTVSVMVPDSLPAMTTSTGSFSAMALGLNIIGGLGFLVAGGFFLKRFCVTLRVEDWMFAVHTILFGAAGVLFAYSVLWDGGWWWWHVLRLAAYVAALLYGLRTFHHAEQELRHLNRQLHETNASLDRTVADRTSKLRATEERFELAIRGSTDGIWDWNIETNEVFYSPRFKELVGYSDEEFPNLFTSFESRLHPEDHDWVFQEIDNHLKRQQPYDVKYRLMTKAEGYRWYRARGQAIWNSEGVAQRMAGSITDVTEEHRLRERFRLAVEASPTSLFMVRRDGQILMANSRSLELFGYDNEELVGQMIEVLVPSRFREGHPAQRESFFRNPVLRDMGTELELLAVRKDGSEFPVKVGLSPVQTAEGASVICGVVDITDQKSALAAMQQAKEAAESASLAKSSFLANMSHEIRTPMNGIIGMTQLLAHTDLRAHQRDYLATIDESAHILLRLLNDILDFSKIEAGKLELEIADFRFAECVARAAQMLVLRAAEKGLEIACRVAPDIPDHLRGDSGRVQQVLVNLLGNAVKFTEAGEIFVNVNAESINSDKVRLHISVSDTGIGIPAEKAEQIFNPFEQAESSTTRRFGGTGLGLAISRQLVEMMHGRMWVESEPGRGSTFHFTAEFGVAADQHAYQPAELASLLNLPVLIVDDNFTNRRVLSEILQHWKMQPLLADSAASARQVLQKAEAEHRPIRLILLDHHMPGEDGFHFAESVRQQLNRESCRIIMISSGSSPVDSEHCQKLGVDRFMTKPVIASDLLNEVLRQFGSRTVILPETPTETVHSDQVHPRRVLLVEDNEINRRVAVGLLRSRGHHVVVAEHGQIAVDTLAEQEFDVVLMDMQMPVLDGYEATAEIRRREHRTGGHIPIVAMTAEAMKGDRERCLASGMDDYVSKPIAPEEMYRAVERFPALCLSPQTAPQDEESSPADSKSQQSNVQGSSSTNDRSVVFDPSVPTEETRPIPPLDWDMAAHRLGGARETLLDFSEIVKQQIPTLMADMQTAIKTGDIPLLRRSAHTLKGSVTYFGAAPLAEAAFNLERLAQTETVDGAPQLLEKIEEELSRFLSALDAGPPT
ncbi:MAG: response regulator [Planctomycetaceae bacterium]